MSTPLAATNSIKPMREILLGMSEQEVVEFARNKALRQKNSAQIEALDLDAELLATKLLEDFRKIRAQGG